MSYGLAFREQHGMHIKNRKNVVSLAIGLSSHIPTLEQIILYSYRRSIVEKYCFVKVKSKIKPRIYSESNGHK